ncbi:hypothetical protein acdb102_45100 [Acidothermaceae bacterium B102]|nr:hypothetical protein acdb102_45100 [Acidothermaceae bacterium B102]
MAGATLTPQQLLELLAATPTRLGAITAGVEPARLAAAAGEDEWSANDVLAHLRSCSDVWGESIGRILVEDRPTIRAVNPTTWIEETDYREQEFLRSLRFFAAQRADLLALLEPLPDHAWVRIATVTGAGSPLTKTVQSYAERLAKHERQHLKQVERIVNG